MALRSSGTDAQFLRNMHIESIKKITYGMEITDEKYTDIIKTVTDSKDALLAAVEKKLESLTKTDVA